VPPMLNPLVKCRRSKSEGNFLGAGWGWKFWGPQMESRTGRTGELSGERSRRCAADIFALRVSKQNYLFPSLAATKTKRAVPFPTFSPDAFLFKLRRH